MDGNKGNSFRTIAVKVFSLLRNTMWFCRIFQNVLFAFVYFCNYTKCLFSQTVFWILGLDFLSYVEARHISLKVEKPISKFDSPRFKLTHFFHSEVMHIELLKPYTWATNPSSFIRILTVSKFSFTLESHKNMWVRWKKRMPLYSFRVMLLLNWSGNVANLIPTFPFAQFRLAIEEGNHPHGHKEG